VPGFDHQDLVAGRQGVDDGRFPGTGPRGRENDHRARCFEDFPAALQNGLAQLGKFGTPVIDHRHVHRPEHPVRDGAWTWDLEKMTSLMLGHAAFPPAVVELNLPQTRYCIQFLIFQLNYCVQNSYRRDVPGHLLCFG
jgi:hypothetical protein